MVFWTYCQNKKLEQGQAWKAWLWNKKRKVTDQEADLSYVRCKRNTESKIDT